MIIQILQKKKNHKQSALEVSYARKLPSPASLLALQVLNLNTLTS